MQNNRPLGDFPQFYYLLVRGTIFDKNKFLGYDLVSSLRNFGSKKYIETGLSPEEKKLYFDFEDKPGRALIMGCSAGRECVYLAQKGWEVIGIDFIEEFLKIGRFYAKQKGLGIEYRNLNIEQLDSNSFSGERFDFIGFSVFFLILSKKKRSRILKILNTCLSKDGKVLVILKGRQDHWRLSNPILNVILKILRPSHEDGDYFGGATYLHTFTAESLKKEIEAQGFRIKLISAGRIYKYALLEKTA